MDRLKLMALDAQDLAVISAQVQDAVTRPDALDYRPREKRFTLVINRFAWDAAGRKTRDGEGYERRQAVLSFARVLKVRTNGVRRGDDGQVLSLLAIRFSETDAPAGTVELVFADGPIIQLDVECVEAQLEDLGAAWETRFKPRHPVA
ncbi:DUF2948 family protein [Oricola sp.]|uniref:DUF2948 family protein n=1 Tax=Oricola sp. TaxID=1979950 RepID=UPI0025E2E471|nr:DUF2948 family protein [Oricola sp.]MCI5074266.1 DUF2948 family protein [Oricola sp.]